MKPLDQSTILIVGLGQIGGSIGIDLIARRTLTSQGTLTSQAVARVIGFDSDSQTLAEAIQIEAIDEAVASLDDGFSQADIIILAMPIRAIINAIPRLLESIPTGREISFLDVAGTKVEILDAVASIGKEINYVSGHPLAGTEGHGINSATADLFLGQPFILTPAPTTSGASQQIITQLVVKLGARPITVTAADHDRMIARTSHLPYALALALKQTVASFADDDARIENMTAGSYQSATRVASSPLELIVDMFLTNSQQTPDAIDDLIGRLTTLRDLIANKDEAGLVDFVRDCQI